VPGAFHRPDLAAGVLNLDAAVVQELAQELLNIRGADPGRAHARVDLSRRQIRRDHGDAAAALRLSGELLPDMVRVLGPDHPNVLTIRANIAAWTARSGANAEYESEANPDDTEPESKIGGS